MEFKNIRWGLILSLTFLLLLNFSCKEESPYTPPDTPVGFIKGADISLLQRIEDLQGVYKENGQAKDPLLIFDEHGFNCMRLRIFHTPNGVGPVVNDLPYTLPLAKRIKNAHLKFLLDFHYSDTWADPAHQTKPAAWEGLSFEDLVDSLFEYTRSVITALKNEGALPDIVQIGNEITPGFLWPDGKLPDNWDNFIDLTKAGIKGVKAGKGSQGPPLIMIQIDKGGDKKATKWFLDKINSYDVEYEVIGQSYYPWWHGTLNELWDNINFMVREYEKDIILVEVAYHWKSSRYIEKEGPFPETPQGQKEFLEELNRLALMSPEFKVRGVFWWEPAVDGNMRGIGSRGFFDEDGKALPVIAVFDKYTRY